MVGLIRTGDAEGGAVVAGRCGRWRLIHRPLLSLLLGVVASTGLTLAPPAQAAARSHIYLVVLDGPGTVGDRSGLPAPVVQWRMLGEQDSVLSSVDAPAPIYRWTHALNGVAVELDATQAQTLAADPTVALVERNQIRQLTGVTDQIAARSLPTRSGRAAGPRGRGVVIGFIDSGLSLDGPLLAENPAVGALPARFRGDCTDRADGAEQDHWATQTCSNKVVGGDWFVAGFGADRVSSSATLSPADDDGHGTALASIAAGNAGVEVRMNRTRLGRFVSAAPQARVAAYKACWTAPDPRHDGCASADLVSAIDRAVADRVDVLNLAVEGPSDRADAVELALLGAAEANIVVVAAAGNQAGSRYAAHPSPWVTTVGGTTGAQPRGQVRFAGRDFGGVMTATRPVRAARVVLAGRVAAAGTSSRAARFCEPGTLDAARVAGRVVICERGRIGRIDKSAAVARADGVGMVLVNARRGGLSSDFHAVPTVHVNRAAGRALIAEVRRHPWQRISLVPTAASTTADRAWRRSSPGAPGATVLKPDLSAPATGVLALGPAASGPVAADEDGTPSWQLISGTSAATAAVSSAAAALLSRTGWSAAQVRSALVTSATPLAAGSGSARTTGAGVVNLRAAEHPGLIFTVRDGDYRAWLNGRRATLNLPSLMFRGHQSVLTRTVTNVSANSQYFSSTTGGFSRHRVQVFPAALRLAPGASATFRVVVDGPAAADSGWVQWLGATGTTTRLPVVISR